MIATESQHDSVSESRVRSLAARRGFRVEKSRRAISLNNLGDYRLIELYTNSIVLGERYEATLEEVEAWLRK